jgi:ATP-dependent Clp protease ATP-binding subunit ClpA
MLALVSAWQSRLDKREKLKESIAKLGGEPPQLDLPTDLSRQLSNVGQDMNQTFAAWYNLLAKRHQQLEKVREIEEEIEKIRTKEAKSKPSDDKEIPILIDEVEKANVTLHNLLLRIMEEGSVEMANGSRTDLTNSFIAMTSNVGAMAMGGVLRNNPIGFKTSTGGTVTGKDRNKNTEDVERQILNIAERELGKAFAPEFRGRIDEVVIFRPLDRESFVAILNRQITEFNEALAEKEIRVLLDENVRDLIIKKSTHRPDVGARLLRQKFKKMIKLRLGRIIGKEFKFKGLIRAYLNDDGNVDFAHEKITDSD